MKPAANPFSVPAKVEPALGSVQTYWLSLRRGGNDMPFSDDVDPTKLSEIADDMMLITAFENPERFRFEAVGARIVSQYGAPLSGEFSDELEQRPPLKSFTEQCGATVAQRAPTYYRTQLIGPEAGYARILLPTWGDGHVMMLLGAITPL
ncbi:PAS domain-containing protein [Microvirga sp. 2TAF3]|uniref:PAS domain-containing protein n=1 Tax=Microvirga sp. 2TAF3 TaxID=3233014 RepID=UPI003F998FBA